jgi:hypothetical protein
MGFAALNPPYIYLGVPDLADAQSGPGSLPLNSGYANRQPRRGS